MPRNAGDPPVPPSVVGILPTMRRIMWGGSGSDGEVGAGGTASASGHRSVSEDCAAGAAGAFPPSKKEAANGRRTSTATPTLISSTRKRRSAAMKKGGSSSDPPPAKKAKRDRSRSRSGATSPPGALSEQSSDNEYDSSNVLAANDPQIRSTFLRRTPPEVVGLCLSYLSTSADRFALQTTCRMFRILSNSSKIASQLQLGGNPLTAKGALITDNDDPDSAVGKLVFFARMGNLEAVYM